MKTLLAVALLLAPLAALAADPDMTPNAKVDPILKTQRQKELSSLDRAIAEMMTAFDKTEACFADEADMQKELNAKKVQLAGEFGGAIPLAFTDLLWNKKTRIDKTHQACVQAHTQLGRIIADLDGAFGNVDPTLNVKKQRAEVNAQKERYIQMMPPSKRAAKKAGKAAN